MKDFFLYFKFVLTPFLFVCFVFLNLVSSLSAESTELFLPFPETWTKEGGKETTESQTKNPLNSTAMMNPVQGTPSKSLNNLSTQNNSPESLPSKSATQENQAAVTINAKPTDKKKKKKEVIDPSLASFQKGKAYLTRDQKKTAESEFADSYGKEGDAAKFSRVENSNLFGLDGKEKDSLNLVEKQEDPDFKIKTQFELARSLDRIGNPEAEEKAYKEYLKLVTEYPKHPELTPRSHYAMAILLIRKKEFRSAVHQLVNIIKNFKESAEYLPSHYYLGKIYESSWEERDLERSLKYYQLYMNGVEGKTLVPGYDFKKETRERMRVLGSSI